jgi:hypothetical protein
MNSNDLMSLVCCRNVDVSAAGVNLEKECVDACHLSRRRKGEGA